MTDYRNTIGKKSRSVSANATQTGASGQVVDITSVEVSPDIVAPGGTIEIRVVLQEKIEVVGPFDPNLCDPPDWLPIGTGLAVDVTVTGDWGRSNSDTGICVPVYSLKGGRAETTIDLDVPSDIKTGEHQIDVSADFSGSGDNADSQTTTISVQESGRKHPSCQKDSDCGWGMVCRNGRCVESGGGINVGRWVLTHPIESAVGFVGFGIIVNTLVE